MLNVMLSSRGETVPVREWYIKMSFRQREWVTIGKSGRRTEELEEINEGKHGVKKAEEKERVNLFHICSSLCNIWVFI
jgi:hypothetical protein